MLINFFVSSFVEDVDLCEKYESSDDDDEENVNRKSKNTRTNNFQVTSGRSKIILS